MKVNYSKKGSKWQIIFSVENVDPSGMVVAGNFNDWNSKDPNSGFLKGKQEIKVLLPGETTVLSFKVFDNANDCWCEVYDNGELYAGLESFFVTNEMGTINIVVPLVDQKQLKPAARKSPPKKSTEPKAEKAPAKRGAKKSTPKA